ncbi:MAG: cytoplasmic protein [Chloroflexi bacterium]|nr:cytoplasmic protein [Chloroflexota bacterium]
MDTKKLESLISQCLSDFYESRLQKVKSVKLHAFLRRKNPYLFRALGIQKASEIVERLLADYISASDETIFGNAFFEPIARIASGGKASDAEGVDFVIESGKSIKAIALKSGPNIYNSSQKKRQSQEFLAVRSRLYKLHKQFDPILGHAYGRVKSKPGKDLIYRDISGQAFWTEITGDPDFYLKLVRLMKEEPAKHRKEYAPAWDAAVNRFTREFIDDFCFKDGTIDWEKLVSFVSEEKSQKSVKKSRKAK